MTRPRLVEERRDTWGTLTRVRFVTDTERRARLARRHALAGELRLRLDDPLRAREALRQALAYSGGSSVGKAALLTVVYSLGMGIPFLIAALALRRGMGALDFFKRHRVALQRFGGLMLVVIGVLMVSGVWTAFVSWIQSELVQDFVPVI